MRSYSILGAARSGIAVARLLVSHGARVFVSDAKQPDACGDAAAALEALGAAYEFGGHTDRVLDCDALVLSPGVPDTIPIVVRARERGITITSEIEVAWRHCRAPVVAITGTNGKTTTTELAGHVFRTAGRRTFVAGNVGIPFSEVVADADAGSVVVLEMSSFQLEHIETFKPRVSVLLNVTPDHMDRYAGFEEYRAAKYRIAMRQDAGDTVVANADDPHAAGIASQTAAHLLPFSIERELNVGAFQRERNLVIRFDEGDSAGEDVLMPIDEIGIRGPHNLYNAMAAALAARTLGVSLEAIRSGLASFPGVPHRLESIRELDGVRWINDSKATNVDSLRYALLSFTEPIVLIAGGRSKKNVYDALLPLVERHVKAIVLVGEAAGEMEAAFGSIVTVRHAGFSMEQAVEIARELAASGDVVLLSPACASFDMFNNYEHRGEVFRELVAGLEPRAAGAHAATTAP